MDRMRACTGCGVSLRSEQREHVVEIVEKALRSGLPITEMHWCCPSCAECKDDPSAPVH